MQVNFVQGEHLSLRHGSAMPDLPTDYIAPPCDESVDEQNGGMLLFGHFSQHLLLSDAVMIGYHLKIFISGYAFLQVV